MGLHKKGRRPPLDWRMLEVEPTGSNDFGPCSCCGNMSRTVWGFVHSLESAVAAYFVQWTRNGPDHGASIDLIIGKWGEGTSNEDRQAVSVEYRVFGGKGSLMVIDAANRPVSESSAAGQALRRDQVIGTPLADDVFAIVDAVFAKEPRLEEVRSW
jgi:hypothetical protein